MNQVEEKVEAAAIFTPVSHPHSVTEKKAGSEKVVKLLNHRAIELVLQHVSSWIGRRYIKQRASSDIVTIGFVSYIFMYSYSYSTQFSFRYCFNRLLR